MNRIFVTGIGTGIGKTVVSAIITEALHADYWKPVQSGSVEGTDAETVGSLISNKVTKIHQEAYCLRLPISPHAAAKAENVHIQIRNIPVPQTKNSLIIEGAGGLMVPLNDKELIIDLIKEMRAKVVLVVSHYLGSINHTLLSLSVLKERNIPLAGIIYNGIANAASEEAIAAFGNVDIIGRIDRENKITPAVILKYAENLQPALKALIAN